MRSLKSFYLVALLVCLAGCAQLGLAPAETFSEKLAYMEGVNTALREGSTDALNHREITSADMEHVIDINTKAKTLLSAARMFKDTDMATAQAKLTAATLLIGELQAYLRARGVKTSQLRSPTWKKPLLLSYSH